MFCPHIPSRRRRFVLTAILMIASPPLAFAECATQVGKIKTLGDVDVQAMGSALDRLLSDGTCTKDDVQEARKAAASALLREASNIQSAAGKEADYAHLVRLAAAQNVFYVASWRLGDIERQSRNYIAAANAYQKAIELLGEDIVERRKRNGKVDDLLARGRDLMARADEARLLAASAARPVFVPALSNHRGELDGSYNATFTSTSERGIAVEKVASPITFEYDSATFTPIGVTAAQELVTLLSQRKPTRVRIIGHTDQKGSDEYNLSLSERRAQAVASFLKSKGVDAMLEAQGKGKREPRPLSSGAAYPQAEIDQLNRRVEVTWDQ